MTLRSFPTAVKFLVSMSLALGLAACASDKGPTRPASAPPVLSETVTPEAAARGPAVADAASGSRIENVFVTSDTDLLSRALGQALDSPEPEKAVRWDNPVTGAAGTVGVRQAYLTNVENVRGGRLWSPTGLDTSWVLEPAQGEYSVAGAGVNVRLGPSTKGFKVAKLGQGMVVDALGREPKNDWLLVAQRGVVLGYIYGPLLQSRDGDDLMLAGGASRRPVLCRDFQQTVLMPNGVKDEWEASACRTRKGEWKVVEDVLGFTG